MLRREFFSVTAGGFALTEPIDDKCHLPDAIILLEKSIRAEIPGIKTIQVKCNPADPKVPFMMVAYRF